MGLHGCARCLKYAVFLLSFIYWLAGMAVLGVAVWLRTDPKAGHFVNAGYGEAISTYYILTYIMMVVGAVMTFVGFLGCCGAFQESRCMIVVFCILLSLIFVAQVVCGVFAFIHQEQIQGEVTITFKTHIKKYAQAEENNRDESVDFVQKMLRCCGGEDVQDWIFDEDGNRTDIVNINTVHVPPSCCRSDLGFPRKVSGKGLCGAGKSWDGKKHSALYPNGCGPKILEAFRSSLLIIGGIGLGLAGIEVLGFIAAVAFSVAMSHTTSQIYKLDSPTKL